ncbi:MAG: ATP-binding cassette domain-containing protein, partial [Planctomycetes bacterium]|nr:ATP-binding cassette domain-containing protein [Planctomycetota bacterium]
MLRLESISRTIGNFTLSDITFSAGKGQYVVILGPTGCGKTMLLETIAGIGRPAKGSIFIKDEDVTHIAPEKRNIGFVYQRSMLFPHYSVARNISFGMRLRKVGAAAQEDRINRL